MFPRDGQPLRVKDTEGPESGAGTERRMWGWARRSRDTRCHRFAGPERLFMYPTGGGAPLPEAGIKVV
jgi:hypothetical protein